MLASIFLASACNSGQNVLRHLRKLGTKTHFAKLTRVLPLKKASGCWGAKKGEREDASI